MDIAITGSSGLIGTALAARLRREGHRVRPVVRRPAANDDEIRWDPTGGTIESREPVTTSASISLLAPAPPFWACAAQEARPTVIGYRSGSLSMISGRK